MLLRRCHPSVTGYESLEASIKVNVLLAIIGVHKDHGVSFKNSHKCVSRETSVSEPPWKAQEILEFKELMMKSQAKARSIYIKRS